MGAAAREMETEADGGLKVGKINAADEFSVQNVPRFRRACRFGSPMAHAWGRRVRGKSKANHEEMG